MTDLCAKCVHQAVCFYKNDFQKLIESTPKSLWETNSEENTHRKT